MKMVTSEKIFKPWTPDSEGRWLPCVEKNVPGPHPALICMDMRLGLLLCFLFSSTTSACMREISRAAVQSWTLLRWWRASRKVEIVYGFQDSSANVPSDDCQLLFMAIVKKHRSQTYVSLISTYLHILYGIYHNIEMAPPDWAWAQHTSGETLPGAADTDGREISSSLI